MLILTVYLKCENGQNKAAKYPKDLEVFFCLFSEESNFRNKQSMVQYFRSCVDGCWTIGKKQNINHTFISNNDH